MWLGPTEGGKHLTPVPEQGSHDSTQYKPREKPACPPGGSIYSRTLDTCEVRVMAPTLTSSRFPGCLADTLVLIFVLLRKVSYKWGLFLLQVLVAPTLITGDEAHTGGGMRPAPP